ncbi:Protein GrpE [uncultured Alphaproteobacteria bacterium]|uniref:Protein GrpE n=1 Tax=uncultured Alphaproteobacteria bacterium TaxID=91750 RepID=A0A212KB04_9PROT|nr:Protein GrpE [uncultured Alphaproteobacteria bacterium]
MTQETEANRPEAAETPETPEVEAVQPAPEDRIAELEAEVAKLKDAYIRAHADMENLRKRTAAELEQKLKYAQQPLANAILPVADNLRRALGAVPQGEAAADDAIRNLIIGLEMTEKELLDALARNQVKPVPGVGAPFDPHLHQAVQEVEDPEVPTGTVVQVFQTGYQIHDRLLRAAMVVVSKGGPKGQGQEPGGPGMTVDTQA